MPNTAPAWINHSLLMDGHLTTVITRGSEYICRPWFERNELWHEFVMLRRGADVMIAISSDFFPIFRGKNGVFLENQRNDPIFA
jgi:hypothetical protein